MDSRKIFVILAFLFSPTLLFSQAGNRDAPRKPGVWKDNGTTVSYPNRSVSFGSNVSSTNLPNICQDSNASHTGASGVEFVCNTATTFTPVSGSFVYFRFAAAGNAANAKINVNGSGNKFIGNTDFGNVSPFPAANTILGDASISGQTVYYLLIYTTGGTPGWILYQNPTGNAASVITNTPTTNGLVYSRGTADTEGAGLLSVSTGCTNVSGTGITCTGAVTGSNTPLTGVTGSIGGGALAAGACTTGTVAVTNSTTAMSVAVSPSADPQVDGTHGVTWEGWVSTAGTVTVRVCAIVATTPSAQTYNVRVIP